MKEEKALKKKVKKVTEESVPFKANRKNKTINQLRAECRRRKVGFMMTWTKEALIKRLDEEDKRDATLELALNKTVVVERDQADREEKEEKTLKRLKRQLQNHKKEYEELQVEISELNTQKNELCEYRAKLILKIKQVEGAIEAYKEVLDL